LPGIDNLVPGGRRADLLVVSLFDGIAKDNPHYKSTRLESRDCCSASGRPGTT
jgi:hypothetical protein